MYNLIVHPQTFLFHLLLLLHPIYIVTSQPFMGVVLRTGIHNLPKPHILVQFLNATSITKVRMNYHQLIIKEFQDTAISSVTVHATEENGAIPANARDKEFQFRYVVKAIQPNVHTLLVGDKVFEFGDQDSINGLIPAMENLQSVIDEAGLRGKVKVSTIISTNSLTKSDIPSEASFKPAYRSVIVPLLQFLRDTGSVLQISAFPYYDYVENPTPHVLKLCLFQPNSGRLDPATGKNYTNMFAIKIDSMRNALDGLGFEDINFVVAETGWPTSKNKTQFAGGLKQARTYNWNLIQYLRSMVGTPLMPNKSIDTYILSLFDLYPRVEEVPDELKSCGIVNSDLSWKYDILCLKR